MPNRLIKESACTSDNLNALSAEEERFFYRLIVNCDDYGIADARLPILRSKCFPLKLDEIKEKDIERWLNALIKANLVFIYKVGDRPYLKMTSWEKHQQIRAKKSKFPLPDSDGAKLISDDIRCNQDDINGNQLISDDDICPRNPIQSNPIRNPNPNPIPYAEIIDYLNLKAGTKYRHDTSKNKDLIKARWNEKFGVTEFKTVIDKKCAEWLGTEQEKYLRPETLFGTKFESYLNQLETKYYNKGKPSNFNNHNQRPYDAVAVEQLQKQSYEGLEDSIDPQEELRKLRGK